MLRRFGWILLVGTCSFLGGAAGLLISSRWEPSVWAQGSGPARDPAGNLTDAPTTGERFESVARRVSPAVVYVEARKPSEKPNSKRMVEESGSGVLVRWEGRQDYLVLTNNHVVTGTEPSKILVSMANGRVLQPTRVWADPESDIAVLSVTSGENLPVATMGDSDRVQVGSWVLAIGSPFGLNQTVTHGIVSARERGEISLGSTIRIKDFLQTDAAINPGSSGGPLVNVQGEIIGINTAIASPNGSNSGVAFSIPINLYRRIVTQLLERGSVARGYLGIQLAGAVEAADAIKLGLDRAQGAVIEVVYPDTPGAVAGLKAGDVILQMDQATVRNENHLINMISATSPGREITLKVLRDGQQLTVNARIGEWTKGQDRLR